MREMLTNPGRVTRKHRENTAETKEYEEYGACSFTAS
jgi:hypothetical protein